VNTTDPVLSDVERQFASEHHQLIYGFLNKHALAEGEYYDVAAPGFLRAVHNYLTKAELRRFSFSTIAYRAMSQSVSQYRRSLKRQTGLADVLSLDTGGIDGRPLATGLSAAERAAYTELEENLLLHALIKKLPPWHSEVVRLRLLGYGIHEIAQRQAVSDKTMRKLLRQIREVFVEVCRS
jgi:RNA polymerase sigma factor (sigma-70 family)